MHVDQISGEDYIDNLTCIFPGIWTKMFFNRSHYLFYYSLVAMIGNLSHETLSFNEICNEKLIYC